MHSHLMGDVHNMTPDALVISRAPLVLTCPLISNAHTARLSRLLSFNMTSKSVNAAEFTRLLSPLPPVHQWQPTGQAY